MASSLKAPIFTMTAKLEGADLKVTAISPKGHHFNTEAPAALMAGASKIKPAPFTKSRADFAIPAKDLKEFRVSLFVCDDANTFCEKHVVRAEWSGSALKVLAQSEHGTLAADVATGEMEGVARGAAAPVKATKPKADDSPTAPGDHGFIVNEPARALELAREQNKPLLIDFYGIWCPPCNEYDAKVFATPEFARETAGFIKLKVDVDQKVSWPLKSKHHVRGYPTILFATPEGDEISRIVGYREKPLFLKAAREAFADRGMTLAKLKIKADGGNADAAERLGMIHLEKEEFADAEKYLAKSRSSRARQHLFEAKTGRLKSAGGAPYLAALEEAVKVFPDKPGSIAFWQALAGEVPAKKAEYLGKAIEVSQALIASPAQLAGEDWTVADLWATVADAQADLGRDAEAKAAWLKSAAEFEKRSIGPKDRGNSMEAAWGYWNGGKVEEAEKIYSHLEATYPTEFTYYYYHSRMFLALKRFKEAREKAEKAYTYAYGDNRLRVAEALAKALKGEARAADAKKLVQDVLKETVLPEDATVRTHRYAKALRELEKTL